MPPKTARRELSEFQRGQIIGLRRAGWSFRAIALEVGCGKTTAKDVYQRWTENRTIRPKKRSGRPRKTLTLKWERIIIIIINPNLLQFERTVLMYVELQWSESWRWKRIKKPFFFGFFFASAKDYASFLLGSKRGWSWGLGILKYWNWRVME